MGTRLTGSALPRARHCAWPYRLDVVYPEREQRQDATEGQETHSMLEHWLAGEEVPSMGPRAQTIFEQVKAYFKEPGGRAPEAAFAIDVETGEARILGYRMGRKYGPLKDSEIALTVDWAGDDEVGDLKTGFAGHVAHPRENLQLLAGAYALAKVKKLDSVFVKILIAREDEVVPLWAKLDGGWMDSVLAELREIHFRAQLPSPAVAGEHCQFCPALGACPQTAQAGALMGAANADQPAVRWGTEFVSAENDAAMVMNLTMLEKAIDAVKDALKRRGPITLPNGKVWRESISKRRVLDKEALERTIDTTPYYRDIEIKSWRQMKP